MNKNNTILILIFSIFTTLLSIGMLVFFFKVIQNKNKHTSVIWATLKEKIIEKENKKILEEKFFEIENTQQKIGSYFINPTQIDIFVSYLEDLGVSTGTELLVKSVEISKTKPDVIMVSLSINGLFSKIMNIITLLENIPYQINITQIYLNKEIEKITTEDSEKNKTQILLWQADITFNILYFP